MRSRAIVVYYLQLGGAYRLLKPLNQSILSAKIAIRLRIIGRNRKSSLSKLQIIGICDSV
jgi:hypothetical protein